MNFAFAAFLLLGTAAWRFMPVALYYTFGFELGPRIPDQALIAAGFLAFTFSWALLLWLRRRSPGPSPGLQWAAVLGLYFIYLSFRLLFFQQTLYSQSLLRPSYLPDVLVAFCLAFLFVPPAAGLRLRPGTLVLLSLAACLAIRLLCQRALPLESGFSDLLLAIREGGESFLRGEFPNHEGQPGKPWNPYLPALWLAYLPAVALKLDPRWMNLIFLSALAWLVYKGFAPERRALGGGLLCLFLLNPWLQFRHETHIPALLLGLALHQHFAQRDRPLAAGAALGLVMAAYQVCWPLGALWFAWSWRRLGARAALAGAAAGAAVFAALMIPMFVWDFERMKLITLGIWMGLVAPAHFNLVYWLPDWVPALRVLQLAACFFAAWALWRGRGSFASLMGWSTAAMTFIFVANHYVQHYFFFIVALSALQFLASRPNASESPA